jgi:hypothetical protein
MDEVAADWAALARPTDVPAGFDVAAADELPEAARRWITHAIAAGTPLRTSVELRMHGEIRLGAWRAFSAVQRLTAADGFVWAATARLLGLPVTGFDRYTRGTGQMRWRLLNALPVMSAGRRRRDPQRRRTARRRTAPRRARRRAQPAGHL